MTRLGTLALLGVLAAGAAFYAAMDRSALPELSMPEAPLPEAPVSRAEAPEPVPIDGGTVTNESLQGFLSRERERMGIRDVVPVAEDRAPEEGRDAPLERVRRMGSDVARINRQRQEQSSPSVYIAQGRKPLLISGPGPLEEAAPRAWAGIGAAQAEAVLVKDEAQWEGLWKRLGAAVAPASPDFGKDMAVAVFGRPGAKDVEISALRTGGTVIEVEYRDSGPGARGGAPYRVRVTPRSEKKVFFKNVGL